MSGYDLFSEYCSEDEGDDAHSTCSTVYSVGDVSLVTNDEDDDVACIKDIEDEELDFPMDSEENEDETESTTEPLDKSPLLEARPGGCPGYTLVIDNIDMNIRRSEQRMGRTTKSYHYCHGYAVKNRVNSTSLTDGPPSGVLSAEKVLPSKIDMDKIMDEFKVIVSRYCKISSDHQLFKNTV